MGAKASSVPPRAPPQIGAFREAGSFFVNRPGTGFQALTIPAQKLMGLASPFFPPLSSCFVPTCFLRPRTASRLSSPWRAAPVVARHSLPIPPTPLVLMRFDYPRSPPPRQFPQIRFHIPPKNYAKKFRVSRTSADLSASPPPWPAPSRCTSAHIFVGTSLVAGYCGDDCPWPRTYRPAAVAGVVILKRHPVPCHRSR